MAINCPVGFCSRLKWSFHCVVTWNILTGSVCLKQVTMWRPCASIWSSFWRRKDWRLARSARSRRIWGWVWVRALKSFSGSCNIDCQVSFGWASAWASRSSWSRDWWGSAYFWHVFRASVRYSISFGSAGPICINQRIGNGHRCSTTWDCGRGLWIWNWNLNLSMHSDISWAMISYKLLYSISYTLEAEIG